MTHDLSNSEYGEDDFLVKQIAQESPLFNSYLQAALNDVDAEFPTEEIWLGTLQLGRGKIPTQIKLTISQDFKHFIDEG